MQPHAMHKDDQKEKKVGQYSRERNWKRENETNA